MPNTFAHLVFFSWPLVAILFFAAQPPARALAASVIVGYLLLPERVVVNLPMIPAINKVMMINLTALVVVMLALRRHRLISGAGPEAPMPSGTLWVFRILILLMVVTPFITMLTNGEPVIAGPRYIPGIRLYDAFAILAGVAIMLVPFLLGMHLLRTPEAQVELLKVLVGAACVYACLALFEVRMSPQLSSWIYGYFPHSFAQHIRSGGFRPVVFLHHGLWLGMFLCMAVLGACALWRQALRDRVQAAPWLAATLWLALTLLLSRNLGATALALLFAPLILFTPPRVQILVAAVVAGAVLSFPMLRGAGLVPTDSIVSLAQMVNEDRAGSLQFRFDHEDALLARANEKPLAGWGTWGRNRVYDADSGRDLSVTDGIWVIIIGTFGWVGYIAQFGLLATPLLLLLRQRQADLAPVTTRLALLMAVALIDLIPNATLTPVTWLVAGAVAAATLRGAQLVCPAETGRMRAASMKPNLAVGPLGSASLTTTTPFPRHIRQPRS